MAPNRLRIGRRETRENGFRATTIHRCPGCFFAQTFLAGHLPVEVRLRDRLEAGARRHLGYVRHLPWDARRQTRAGRLRHAEEVAYIGPLWLVVVALVYHGTLVANDS